MNNLPRASDGSRLQVIQAHCFEVACVTKLINQINGNSGAKSYGVLCAVHVTYLELFGLEGRCLLTCKGAKLFNSISEREGPLDLSGWA